MLFSSFINGKGLHPLLASTADLIRRNISNIPELILLDFDPELTSIYKKVDGDDLFIVNELHQARGFRKLHVELARIGSFLQILHCVFFPDPRFNLPIFGVDIVAGVKGVSAAIVDLSPVDSDLPEQLQNKLISYDCKKFKSVRKLPEWGNIFSTNVCFIKPENSFEEKEFLAIIDNYLVSLLEYSKVIKPDTFDSAVTIERYKRQQLYCLQQKRNDKTRNVLAKTFSPEWADRYIDIILFDCPPLV